MKAGVEEGTGLGSADFPSVASISTNNGVVSSTESHEEDNGGWSSFVSMGRVLPA